VWKGGLGRAAGGQKNTLSARPFRTSPVHSEPVENSFEKPRLYFAIRGLEAAVFVFEAAAK
jgi:hypothetical protein